MSIIDNEAENWYGGKTYMYNAYIVGATRQPTNLFCSVAPSAASRSRGVARLPETRIACNAT